MLALWDALLHVIFAIRRHTLRTTLAGLGVAAGTGSLVMLGWLAETTEHALRRAQPDGASAAVAVFASGLARGADPTRGLGPRERRAVVAARGLFADEHAHGLWATSRTASRGSRTLPIGLRSIPAGEDERPSVAEGRWPTLAEARARVCVVGAEVAATLGARPAGSSRLVLDGRWSCAVVGVLVAEPPREVTDADGSRNLDRAVYVPEAVLTAEVGEEDLEARLSLRAPDLRFEEHDADGVHRVLEVLHRGAQDVTLVTDLARQSTLRKMALGLVAVLVACALFATFVGGVNLLSAELVSVQERRRELALARALGLSRRRLAWRVRLDALILASASGGLGAMVALGASAVGARVLSAVLVPWSWTIPSWALVASGAASVAAGWLAGDIPARRASEASLRDALDPG